MDSFIETVKELVAGYAFKVVGVLVFIIAAWIIAGWVRRLVTRSGEKRNLDVTITRFTGNLARWAILLMAFVGCLAVFGVETTSFAAVIGAAGLAIGLAFQGSLSNLAAGIMLLIFRPFKVGDVVSVAGNIGKISEISLFTTIMDTPDNRRIIIPNGQVFGAVIENVTHHETRRVDVKVGTDYGADVDKTREVLEQAATKIPGVLEDPAPQIFLASLGDSCLDWQVRVWAKTTDYFAVLEAGNREVKMSLDAAGINIPYPQMDVHLDKPA